MAYKHLYVALLCLLGTAGSASAISEGKATPVSEIRVTMFADMRSSLPGVNRDAFSDDVLVQIIEPLVVHRHDLTIAPMAAERYSISDDLKTYSFVLRQDLVFHNGVPVTAAHFKATWEKMLDPQTGFQCLPFYNGKMGARIENISVDGPYTLTFHLDKPSSVFLEQLAYVQCPVGALHPASWDKDGNWIKPIATGPFKLKEWKKGRYVLLEKHEAYVPRSDTPSGLAGRKEALVDRLRFLIISDQMAAKAALVSGQVDLVMSLAPISALELRHNKRVKVLDSDGLIRRPLLIQTDDPLLSDVRIRRAIAHALDLKTFASIASLDHAGHNPSTLPASSPNHTAVHKKPYTYDPELARSLLKEAGYQGEEITLKTTKVEQAIFDSAMIAEAMLRQAGFNIRVEVLEMASLLGSYFDGDYQIMAFEYSPRFTAFMNYQSMIGDKAANPNRWGDMTARNLLIDASSTDDPAEQQAIYDAIHTRMMDEVPVINLYNAPIVEAISNRIEGYMPWPGSKPRLWNVGIKTAEKAR